ncbi:MAG: hypothetical protein JSR77_10195 [Planctomycetes bacterium]|nr:hypothetical protein [Planctomycetota bacterium]
MNTRSTTSLVALAIAALGTLAPGATVKPLGPEIWRDSIDWPQDTAAPELVGPVWMVAEVETWSSSREDVSFSRLRWRPVFGDQSPDVWLTRMLAENTEPAADDANEPHAFIRASESGDFAILYGIDGTLLSLDPKRARFAAWRAGGTLADPTGDWLQVALGEFGVAAEELDAEMLAEARAAVVVGPHADKPTGTNSSTLERFEHVDSIDAASGTRVPAPGVLLAAGAFAITGCRRRARKIE